LLTANQEAWLQALESGEFKQTQGTLQRRDCFCCLGVACVVAEKEGIEVYRYTKESQAAPNDGNIGDLSGCTLSAQWHVKDWLDLYDSMGCPVDINGPSLVMMNDNGKTFPEIAAIIRANPEKYFVAPKPANNSTAGGGVLSRV
jgi:hypothetical protein